MNVVYHGDWENLNDMVSEFAIKREDVADLEILFAFYEYEDYSGSALVLYRKDGKLYEVNGSHCSCYGLEDQWEPEETSVEAMLKRKYYGVNAETKDKLVELLKTL